MMLPGAYGAYPAQRGTPYWVNRELRKSKGKIYSQSTEIILAIKDVRLRFEDNKYNYNRGKKYLKF